MTAWYNRGPTKFIATGKLTLQVDVNQYLHLLRRAWNDTQRQRVEDCLNDFVRALILAGEALRLERIRRAAPRVAPREFQRPVRAHDLRTRGSPKFVNATEWRPVR
jgi:hypothetical protein